MTTLKQLRDLPLNESLVDKLKSMNYSRLAKRSGVKATSALDKATAKDFSDPSRYPDEEEFSKQHSIQKSRLAKAK